MRKHIENTLEEKDFRYCESDFWNNPRYTDVERELVRFRWENPKYKGHFKTNRGIHYFDDFIMTEIRHKIEDYKDKVEGGVLHERI